MILKSRRLYRSRFRQKWRNGIQGLLGGFWRYVQKVKQTHRVIREGSISCIHSQSLGSVWMKQRRGCGCVSLQHPLPLVKTENSRGGGGGGDGNIPHATMALCLCLIEQCWFRFEIGRFTLPFINLLSRTADTSAFACKAEMIASSCPYPTGHKVV